MGKGLIMRLILGVRMSPHLLKRVDAPKFPQSGNGHSLYQVTMVPGGPCPPETLEMWSGTLSGNRKRARTQNTSHPTAGHVAARSESRSRLKRGGTRREY